MQQPPQTGSTRKWRGRRVVGLVLTALGALLLAAVGTFYGLSLYSSRSLDGLTVSISETPSMPELREGETEVHGAVMPDGSFKPIQVVKTGAPATDSIPPSPAPAARKSPTTPSPSVSIVSTKSGTEPTPPPIVPAPAAVAAGTAEPLDGRPLVAAYNAIYPGYQMHPKYWHRPLVAGADEYAYGVVLRPDGFIKLSSTEGQPKGTVPDAARIRIPSIGVDSEVANLAIVDLGDSREYETPKHVVGRIPQMSNPGEMGNAWLFGHLESPIRGEGNVFQRLPEIPRLLNNGDAVYISILNGEGDEFLYQVVETARVHQDELNLYETDDSTVTLVACVPRLIYDHRILVTGKLVGVKRAS